MFPYKRLKLFVLAPLLFGLGITVLTFLVYGYQGKIWSQETVFWISDGHCAVPQGIGEHCFGDFALPFFAAGSRDMYYANSIVLSINPPTLLIFELFKMLPYRDALLLYLILAILAICAPFLRRPAHLSWIDSITWMIVGGLLSIGSLASLDRGNNVAFVAPLLFVYLVSLHKKQWIWVVVAITLIATLKIWAVYLIVGLIAFRKYRLAMLSLFLSGLVNFLGILFMHLRGFPQPIFSKVRFTLEMMLDRDYADMVSAYAISFSGLAKRLACLAQQDGACNMISVSQTAIGSSIVKTLILIVCLAISFTLARSKHVPPFIWMTAFGGLGIVAVPEAFVYNAVVVVGALGAVLLTQTHNAPFLGNGKETAWQLLASIPLVFSLTPAALVHHRNWGTAIQTGDEIWWRSYYYTIPGSWIIFFIGSIVLLELIRREQRKLTSSVSTTSI